MSINYATVTTVHVTLLRRGQIRVDGMPFPLSATTAANDLIGLRNDDDYLVWVASTWAGLAPPVDQRAWLKQGVPDLLASAARQAGDDGTLPYRDLAHLLERVRHTSGDQIIVPSLPELAAWALVRAVQAGHHISICGECSNPGCLPNRSSSATARRPG